MTKTVRSWRSLFDLHKNSLFTTDGQKIKKSRGRFCYVIKSGVFTNVHQLATNKHSCSIGLGESIYISYLEQFLKKIVFFFEHVDMASNPSHSAPEPFENEGVAGSSPPDKVSSNITFFNNKKVHAITYPTFVQKDYEL